jgi:amino acid transporter
VGAYIVSGLLVVQLLINLYGVRLASHTNVLAVIAEIISVVALTCLIAAVLLSTGRANVELLTQPPSGDVSYWRSFLMASLLGAWRLIGFEACADVSEETKA